MHYPPRAELQHQHLKSTPSLLVLALVSPQSTIWFTARKFPLPPISLLMPNSTYMSHSTLLPTGAFPSKCMSSLGSNDGPSLSTNDSGMDASNSLKKARNM